jgi:hypothetical protein
MTQLKHPICTLHNTSQLYLTVLHTYMDCNVQLNGELVGIDKTKICVIFGYEWNS